MSKLRDVLIFLAGAEFFNTLTNIMLPYLINLPMHMNFMTMTSAINTWEIYINAAITIALLWWASRIKSR